MRVEEVLNLRDFIDESNGFNQNMGFSDSGQRHC